MFTKLFPYRLHLHILQLDEYTIGKFLRWITSHFFTRTIENKKPLEFTQKAKLTYYLSIFLAIFLIVILTVKLKFFGLVLGVIFATQPYFFLIIATFILLPFDRYKKIAIKQQTEKKLATMQNLFVIGITGSYGKTSVKEFLYQILKHEYSVLKTPESYNTPYGIARVVDLELDETYEYFICEMGAYRIGEIKEICDMVHPTFGILTGINEQHFEKFGTLENTTIGKFELIDSLPKKGIGIVNVDNPHIKNNYQKYEKTLIPYGFTDEKFTIQNIHHSESGSEFMLVLDGEKQHARTNLLGTPNLQNILAAATMSYLLGMKPHAITKAIENLTPVPHRLEIVKRNNMTIIDDAYNSNVSGFKEAITLLKEFKKTKILITPGIVDLGDQTFSIHKQLGELLTDIDYIFLVGNSERTRGLTEGISSKKTVRIVASLSAAWNEIIQLQLAHPVILLENDLPDNY